MRTYALHIQGASGGLELGYDDNRLVQVIIDIIDMTAEQHEWICGFIGKIASIDTLLALKEPKFKVVLVEKVIEFEAFWAEYRYKIGRIERCKKLWKGMTVAERALCVYQIRKYDRYLAHTNIEKLYPETFLSQRRWEADYLLK
jgi:hypothetical protein